MQNTNHSNLGNLLNKLFGTRRKQTTRLNEPSSRYIEFSSPDTQAIFGRNCIPGEVSIETSTTPETADIQYCRA